MVALKTSGATGLHRRRALAQVTLGLAILAVLFHLHLMLGRATLLARHGSQLASSGEGTPPPTTEGGTSVQPGVQPPPDQPGPGQPPGQPGPGQPPGHPGPPPSTGAVRPPPDTRPPPPSGIGTLPLTEILAGVHELAGLPATNRCHLATKQAKSLISVIGPGAETVGQADAILKSGITCVYVTLTPEQRSFIENNPHMIRDLGDPNAGPQGDPLGNKLIQVLEARAGVKSDHLPAAPPINWVAAATGNPQVYREGLLVLERSPDLKITPEQARRILPYLSAEVQANVYQVQMAQHVVAVLTPGQRDRIMASHEQRTNTVVGSSPQAVLEVLRSLLSRSGAGG
jgi:hypothetical protein